jgi:hypothetical protein
MEYRAATPCPLLTSSTFHVPLLLKKKMVWVYSNHNMIVSSWGLIVVLWTSSTEPVFHGHWSISGGVVHMPLLDEFGIKVWCCNDMVVWVSGFIDLCGVVTTW